jgi:hypothetical protein
LASCRYLGRVLVEEEEEEDRRCHLRVSSSDVTVRVTLTITVKSFSCGSESATKVTKQSFVIENRTINEERKESKTFRVNRSIA